MALNIEQLNPSELLRGTLMDPTPAIEEGMTYPALWAPDRQVNVGIDSGSPRLHGSIRVRAVRNALGAAADVPPTVGIDDPPRASERYPDASVAFELHKVAGMAEESIKKIDHGFSAEEEMLLFQEARAAHDIKMNLRSALFYTLTAAEAAAAATDGGNQTYGYAAPGWREFDWQVDGGFGVIGGSLTFLQNFQTIVDAARLAAHGKRLNAIAFGQEMLQRFQRDPTFLGRQTVSVATAAGSALAMVAGSQSVAPPEHVMAVLKQHFGFDEVHIDSSVHQPQKKGLAGASGYIWEDDKIWIGRAGAVQATSSGGQARIVRTQSAYALARSTWLKTEVGNDRLTNPTYREFHAESLIDPVVIQANEGTIISNMS